MKDDLDFLIEQVELHFAYPEDISATWQKTCEEIRQNYESMEPVLAFNAILNALEDTHTQLHARHSDMLAPVPSSMEIFASFQNNQAIITHIRPGHSSSIQNLRGKTILRIQVKKDRRCLPESAPAGTHADSGRKAWRSEPKT